MISRFSFHFLLWSCLLILVGVMGWLSHSMLNAEKRRLAETHQIRLVEQSRLALWRMDSLLAAMIAAENNRSPGEYFLQSDGTRDSGRKDASVPDLSEFAKLYFQIDPSGNVSSPQTGPGSVVHVNQLNRSSMVRLLLGTVKKQPVPAPVPRKKEEKTEHVVVSRSVYPDRMQAEQKASGERSQKQVAFSPVQQEAGQQELAVDSQKAFQQGIEDYNMRKNLSNSQAVEYNITVEKKVGELARGKGKSPFRGGTDTAQDKATPEGLPLASKKRQEVKGSAIGGSFSTENGLLHFGKVGGMRDEFGEQEAGGEAFSAVQDDAGEIFPESLKEKGKEEMYMELFKAPGSYKELSISSLQPQWSQGAECFLTRRVSDHGQVWVQGIWLDWDKLSGYLLKSVADILPEATLEPAGEREESYLTLAGIPAMLNPGGLPDMAGNSLRTVWKSIAMAWFCGILALCGVIGFMVGIIRLSERRAVFVSAVTHELRTPLTTFNMYTEMLSSGLVPKGREMAYVDILKEEASRLTHLVDNVLSYARVEKNSVTLRPERISVLALATSVIARISPRLAASGMDSQLFIAPELQSESVMADMTAVEQIVYNLADNAAKYARFDGSILKLKLTREKRFLVIRVEDGGKGISESLRRKLFRPFSRSAEEAAGKQPGVRLGLALSRELARGMGGELWLEESSGNGSRFALKLPLVRD